MLERNILNGNALSFKQVDESGEDTDEPIVFSEWSIVAGDKVKRRDFCLDELLEDSADRLEPPSLDLAARRLSNGSWIPRSA